MWPDTEVQPIIEERNKLEDEVRFGQIQKLKIQVMLVHMCVGACIHHS